MTERETTDNYVCMYTCNSFAIVSRSHLFVKWKPQRTEKCTFTAFIFTLFEYTYIYMLRKVGHAFANEHLSVSLNF